MRDPATMTKAEKLAELAEILARAIQRYAVAQIKTAAHPANPQVPLDEPADAEAPCPTRTQRPRSRFA